MQILSFIIFAVIIFTVIIVARTYHWLCEQKYYSPFNKVPSKIIRTYNVHTVKDGFMYTSEIDYMRLSPSGQRYMPKERIQHEKMRVAEIMGRHLLTNGFIEIREHDDLYNPYLHRVDFLLRVYKEGAVEETMKWDLN